MPAVSQDEVVDGCQHWRQATTAHGREAQGGEGGIENRAQEGAVLQQQVEQALAFEQYAGEVGVVELGEHGRHGHQQYDQHEHRGQLMHEAVAPGLQLRAQWYWRLAHEQGCQQCRDHQGAEQDVSAGPGRMLVVEAGGAKAFGEVQRACSSQQRSDPVTGHVTGGECGLAVVFGDFQAIGVYRDVLRR
ncbi:hypothetical protein D3C85_1104120 [compost metagenome]